MMPDFSSGPFGKRFLAGHRFSDAAKKLLRTTRFADEEIFAWARFDAGLAGLRSGQDIIQAALFHGS
jgi:hypothetical protein